MKGKLKFKPQLRATFKFNKKVAKRQMDTSYYVAQHENMKSYQYIEKEKLRLSTRKWETVTKIIEDYKQKGFSTKSTTGKILKGIYEKNKLMALGEIPFQKTTNVLQIIARPETLLLAYRRIKKNRGAMARGANVDTATLQTYTPSQREIYYKKKVFPDRFSLRDVEITGYLILKGKYPWGSSRRIWLEKPGDLLKKRPITIPPFLDRVVQEAIKMVLQAIWEPYFEIRNRSFGFRPNKSSHDAICALKQNITAGLFRAIEGDIQGAYDNVDKNILLQQVGKRIEDSRFIKMLSGRLNYDYTDNGSRKRPSLGIPQGGIDSPYLFNIYLSDLDEYVNTELVQYLEKLNDKKSIPKNRVAKPLQARHNFYQRIVRRTKNLKTIKKQIKDSMKTTEIKKLRTNFFRSIKEIRLMNHHLRNIPYADPNTRKLRLFYVRYADDWIILTNTDAQVAEKLKNRIKEFLSEKLKATLSEPKTLITDIRLKPAHFLGFEISRSRRNRLLYINGRLQRAPGFPIMTAPDAQRVINKLHTRGFCTEKGFPLSIPWLSTLETHVIINRFNASMLGFMQYYAEWVSKKSSLRRWVYIMRYACLKTIAQKYKSSISKVFRRFGSNLHNKADKTITVVAELTVGDVTYQKDWTLLTYKELRTRCLSQKRLPTLSKIFLERETQRVIGEYETNSPIPAITHEDYLKKITWVSVRTQTSFDLPCSICGSPDKVEMHHIKHVRMSAYKLLDKNFLQVLSLRNRKSIPVCRYCHIYKIHAGKYTGEKLNKLININPTIVDNRIVNIESYVKPGEEYYAKSLTEKGWKKQEKYAETPYFSSYAYSYDENDEYLKSEYNPDFYGGPGTE